MSLKGTRNIYIEMLLNEQSVDRLSDQIVLALYDYLDQDLQLPEHDINTGPAFYRALVRELEYPPSTSLENIKNGDSFVAPEGFPMFWYPPSKVRDILKSKGLSDENGSIRVLSIAQEVIKHPEVYIVPRLKELLKLRAITDRGSKEGNINLDV